MAKNYDIEWCRIDTQRRQHEMEVARSAMRRRLAERDAEYARLFPQLVKHQKYTPRFPV